MLKSAIIWLLGWILLAGVEIIFRPIKGPTPLPSIIPITIIIYSALGLCIGVLLGFLSFLFFRIKKKEIMQQRVESFSMATCITATIFLYGVLLVNEQFLRSSSHLIFFSGSIGFILFCLFTLVVLYLFFRRIVQKTHLLSSFLALSISVDLFMVGGLYINENLLSGKFFNLDSVRVTTNLGILIGSVILYFIIYNIFIFIGRSAPKTLKSIPVRALIVIVVLLLTIGGTTLYIKTQSSLEKPIVKSSGQAEDKPNIIVITMDTTRADRLSCYGCWNTTTPNLDKLARESVLFKNAYAPAPWTLPSHAAIFTGMYPARHAAHYDWENTKFDLPTILSEDYKTLAEILIDNGYRTAGVIGGPACNSVFGLAQGFEYYDDDLIDLGYDLDSFALYGTLYRILSRWFKINKIIARQGLNGKRVASQINKLVLPWVEKHYKLPFFLFINYFDPHGPYLPPSKFSFLFREEENSGITESERNKRHLLSQYDGEIAYLDYQMEKLFQKLRELGIYDNTMIIITSDHGEFFGEHDDLWGHGHDLYEEVLKVPLIIKYPSSNPKKGVYSKRVSLVDIMPTILNFLGIPIPRGVQGVDLFEGDSRVMSEIYKHRAPKWVGGMKSDRGFKFNRALQALYHGDYKYIKDKELEDELYNIVEDPQELRNLITVIPSKAREMELKLTEWLSPDESHLSKRELPQLDEFTRESLKALGYIVN